jgi:hypothetical protein
MSDRIRFRIGSACGFCDPGDEVARPARDEDSAFLGRALERGFRKVAISEKCRIRLALDFPDLLRIEHNYMPSADAMECSGVATDV